MKNKNKKQKTKQNSVNVLFMDSDAKVSTVTSSPELPFQRSKVKEGQKLCIKFLMS